MKIICSTDQLPNELTKSIFLAGPTTRSRAFMHGNSIPRWSHLTPWRGAALEYLQQINYDGVVFVPEPRPDNEWPEYDAQRVWELKCLDAADAIVFWVPRAVKDGEALALTTNIEWGKYQRTGKVFFGAPQDADYIRYLQKDAVDQGIFSSIHFGGVLGAAVESLGNGALRRYGECTVPLHIWKTKHFQDWYSAQCAVGNKLIDSRLEYFLGVGPGRGFAFLFVLHVDVWIESEQRIKNNEVVIFRPDVAHVLAYHQTKSNQNALDIPFVMVREFRSPVANETCFVYELPGGSAAKALPVEELAAKEVSEETGMNIPIDRITCHSSRQLNATLSTHHAHLCSVELTELEWDMVQEIILTKRPHGVIEDTERTYMEVITMRQLLNDNNADFATVGMIAEALTKIQIHYLVDHGTV